MLSRIIDTHSQRCYKLRKPMGKRSTYSRDGVSISLADASTLYGEWQTPTVIVSDGPYGVAGFPGDPPTADGLPSWYEPHVERWSQLSTPQTTLWFWNTELGWAMVHPILERYGWKYRCCNIWNKGIAHIAGNSNTQRLRKLPVVSEVCVQYVREASFTGIDGRRLSMKEWLREEWVRSGLPLSDTNKACKVKNAATRKYFTQCHLWYYPPVEAFVLFSEYANRHGRPSGRPYFSIDGKRPIPGEEWDRMRAKFYCEHGVTNVWDHPAVRGEERLKTRYKCVHTNQKPLTLTEMIIRLSSDKGDVVWEPFGGLCSTAIASYRLRRRCMSAEIIPEFYRFAVDRLKQCNAT